MILVIQEQLVTLVLLISPTTMLLLSRNSVEFAYDTLLFIDCCHAQRIAITNTQHIWTGIYEAQILSPAQILVTEYKIGVD